MKYLKKSYAFSGEKMRIFNGHIKKLSYYPQALTATNLQALTS